MRRLSLLPLATALALCLSLTGGAGSAQAIVLGDQGAQAGVALVPGTSAASLANAGISVTTSGGPCLDPALAPDLILPDTGLCSHGGAVMHSNETFALTWDAKRRYWQTTRNIVEKFLSDVAAGSGTLSSPFAVTPQYSDPNGRAKNQSVYGGGCIDYGSVGGSACKFGSTSGTHPGHDYGQLNACPVTGVNQFQEFPDGSWGPSANDICLTDAQVRSEVQSMVSETGIVPLTKPGYTPLVVVLLPPGVKTCLDSSGNLCSANGSSSVAFCSYHSQVDVGGTEVAYAVQPWTAGWTQSTGCDDPGLQPIPALVSAEALARDVGARLVSPVSQAQIASIVNPGLNGWFALNGSEINDNGCVPFGDNLDSVTVGSSGYFLQREFNNAGVIQTDPNGLTCTPSVILSPVFVVPSAVNAGDLVQFDGSTTASTLIVPRTTYYWSFGDGTKSLGPSVVHTYAKGGNYTVKLTVVDRGLNVASLVQTITVLGASGQPPTPPSKPSSRPGLKVRIQLLPQGIRTMLRKGLAVRVSSNEPAAGFATLSISRGTARRAHMSSHHRASVVIGRGTVSGIKAGTVSLHLRLTHAVIRKLVRLRHLTVTVRLSLVAAGRDHVAIDAAGRY